MGKKTAKYLRVASYQSFYRHPIRKQWFESCTKLLEVVFNLKCKRPVVYCYQFLEPTLACTRQHKNYFKLYLEGHVGKGYSLQGIGIPKRRMAYSGIVKAINQRHLESVKQFSELKLEKKIKLHLILKCGEVLLAHYAPLPCIIWCFFVLYGSTKDTAIERAYCRNSARQVIVVRLYLKYLGVFRYFLVSPDYLLHIYS